MNCDKLGQMYIFVLISKLKGILFKYNLKLK